MSDSMQNTSVEPKFSWHFFNAAICTGLWFLSFALSIAVVVALSPQGFRESKVMALVPLFLILVFNVGAMLLASIRASRRTMKGQREA